MGKEPGKQAGSKMSIVGIDDSILSPQSYCIEGILTQIPTCLADPIFLSTGSFVQSRDEKQSLYRYIQLTSNDRTSFHSSFLFCISYFAKAISTSFKHPFPESINKISVEIRLYSVCA